MFFFQMEVDCISQPNYKNEHLTVGLYIRLINLLFRRNARISRFSSYGASHLGGSEFESGIIDQPY